MKRATLLVILFFFIGTSFTGAEDITSGRVILAGKIANYDPAISLRLTVNRLGIGPQAIYPQVNTSGEFHAVFETAIPLDAWLKYKTNFLIQLNPGDSLYVRFNGAAPDRPELYPTLNLEGAMRR